jgi:hypothetical protein
VTILDHGSGHRCHGLDTSDDKKCQCFPVCERKSDTIDQGSAKIQSDRDIRQVLDKYRERVVLAGPERTFSKKE